MAKNNPVTEITSMFNVLNISGLPEGVTWKQEGNKVTFSQPVFIDDETGEISLTNKRKPKMKKKLLESITNVGGFVLSDGESVSDTKSFSDMIGLIDDLIKERKHLKKERKQLIDGNHLLSILNKEAETLINDTLSIAEFKCAKTNNPSNEGRYLCVVKAEYFQYRNIWYSSQWDESETEGLDVIAFTETSPGDILKNLKS